MLGGAHGSQHRIVHDTVGDDEALVARQPPAEREVQRCTAGVGDAAARLVHQNAARGVVPDALLVPRSGKPDDAGRVPRKQSQGIKQSRAQLQAQSEQAMHTGRLTTPT